jgi:hypothetical protein
MAKTRTSESIEPLSKRKACDLAIVCVEIPQLDALDAQSAVVNNVQRLVSTNRRVKEYT